MDIKMSLLTNNRVRVIKITVVLLVLVLGIQLLKSCGSRSNDGAEIPVFTVRKGPLTISITENGTIQNREKVIVVSEAEGQNTIVYLKEEGVTVQKGELLVKLDSSDFEDQKIDQEISMQNAEASLIQARENLAITKNKGKADTEQARLDLRFARLDLKKYEEGEYPMQLQKAESGITLAEEELQNKEDKYAWSKKLELKGYITGVELKGDELSVERGKIDLKTAKGELALLENYTHGKELEKLKSDLSQAEMALERVERKATAEVVNAEADLRARESQFKREKSKLENINEQIEKCSITAPSGGMVVYAQGEGRRRREEPLAVGREVSERQEILYLPTTTIMNARTQIQESSLSKIKEGLPVLVKINALQGVMLDGVLTKIAILPDSTRSWLNPDLKVYNCEVELEESDADLRPGMSCSVTIVIREFDDAVYVPIQSVVRVGNKPTVYIVKGSKQIARTVKTGMNNNRMIHIIDGLSEGEQVSLAPPLKPSEAPMPGGSGKESFVTPASAGKDKGGKKSPSVGGRDDQNRRGDSKRGNE